MVVTIYAPLQLATGILISSRSGNFPEQYISLNITQYLYLKLTILLETSLVKHACLQNFNGNCPASLPSGRQPRHAWLEPE